MSSCCSTAYVVRRADRAGVVAIVVLEVLGLGVLRRAWLNLEKVRAVALVGAGAATALTR